MTSQTSSKRFSSTEVFRIHATIQGPFRPLAVRVCNAQGDHAEVVRSVLPFSVELEYMITAPIRDLALHIKLGTIQGERLFITFDRDDPTNYQRYLVREPGRYVSRCHVPACLLLNRGVFAVEISASVPNVQMLFSEPNVLRFSVDEAGT